MPHQAERLADISTSDAQRPVASGTIACAFQKQADLSANNVAVQLGASCLTYGELDRESSKLAQFLRRYVREPDSLVAIYFERSLEMIVAMLATLKAGAAYLPIDPSNPPDRIDTILKDASPAVILTHDVLLGSVPKSAITVISLDGERETVSREEAARQPPRARPADLAYVIYTSGSTGTPKGVMVTHQNVMRLLRATDPWFKFDAGDVWTLFHSSAFDFSVWEIWGCLLTGGRLVIVPYAISRSPRDFYELLERERVTVLNQTPAAFYQIIQVEESDTLRSLALRYVIFGGEALNFVALRPWFDRHGDTTPKLVNMYGITETTVHVTYRPVSAEDSRSETRSLIGVPIPDLSICLLGENMRPVSVGEIGEIYVAGAGVARGYLNRPELTTERFMPDPSPDRDGSRMYKSGDLARLLENGELEYLGRSDRQVKIRGFRIELGEIEAALTEHSGIRQAVVVPREDGVEQRLVAYFVRKTEGPMTEAELRAFLRLKLPEHMVPYAYVELDALPLNVNGKVDREALPAPGGHVAHTPVAQAALTPLERTVLDVWCRVLNTQHVGLEDNFFDIGGTSILLVAAHSGLERTLRAKIPMTDMFEFTTVRSLARHLARSESDAPTLSTAQQQAQKQRAAFTRYRQRRQGGTP